jgi:hypothetical protein
MRFAFALHRQSLKQAGREELAQTHPQILAAQGLSHGLGQMAGERGQTSG